MSREKIKLFCEGAKFQNFIVLLIIINSITIGLETSDTVMSLFGDTLLLIDNLILAVFVIEITIKLYAYGFSYFKSGWNIFDLSIVALALMPASGSLAVLRSLRIFRALRLIKNLPKLRFIVESLLHSLPSLGWIFALLALVFYVFAVVGTKLYGSSHPDWFGNLWISMLTLFQIMTLEGWAEISRTILVTHPFSYLYFILFILLASYMTLNIFIAIVVNTMSEVQQKTSSEGVKKVENIILDEKEELREDLRQLKEQLIKMEEKLTKKSN